MGPPHPTVPTCTRGVGSKLRQINSISTIFVSLVLLLYIGT